ncbi:hypothetical protein AX27061_2395 [Achromobacter xylosoxidans NBRC 15126 = ATCC 27061]|nr:hypothetical protein AX27061_2395 [Achromobacter xylosoxidans NBRC 15126 = ATCC 27061]
MPGGGHAAASGAGPCVTGGPGARARDCMAWDGARAAAPAALRRA